MAGKSLSTEFVCTVLKEQNLIDDSAVKEIMLHEQAYRALIQKQDPTNSPGAITGVDIISAMGLYASKKPDLLLSEEIIMRALAAHWRLPFLRIDVTKLDPVMARSHLPESVALKFLTIPVSLSEQTLVVAIVNPLDVETLEALKKASPLKIHLAICIKADIQRAIERCYGVHQTPPTEEEAAADETSTSQRFETFFTSSADEYTDQQMIDAVNLLVHYAIEQHTSEIHLKPRQQYGMIQFQIDGILYDVKRIPVEIHERMLNRIKSLAGLKQSDRQLAQEGRSQFKFHDRLFRLNISTMPVTFGEKIVIRILDPLQLFRHIDDMGISAEELQQYQCLIAHSHGFLLITGPTGNGKTTTLYSTFKHLSEKGLNILTVEDPIDTIYEEFNQLIVLQSIGMTPEIAMQYIRQQAPAAVLVGMLRDREQIEQAMRLALYGHLVCAAFQAADALSALVQVLQLGIAPLLIESAMIAIVAQRLLRKVCEQCAQPYQLTPQELVALHLSPADAGQFALRKGSGCPACRGTGYWGQTAIFEIMELTDELKVAIHHQAGISELRQVAINGGMRPFRSSALEKMKAGITTSDEVLRVTGGLQEAIPHTFKSKITLHPQDEFFTAAN